jgi:hypothetical protein
MCCHQANYECFALALELFLLPFAPPFYAYAICEDERFGQV